MDARVHVEEDMHSLLSWLHAAEGLGFSFSEQRCFLPLLSKAQMAEFVRQLLTCVPEYSANHRLNVFIAWIGNGHTHTDAFEEALKDVCSEGRTERALQGLYCLVQLRVAQMKAELGIANEQLADLFQTLVTSGRSSWQQQRYKEILDFFTRSAAHYVAFEARALTCLRLFLHNSQHDEVVEAFRFLLLFEAALDRTELGALAALLPSVLTCCLQSGKWQLYRETIADALCHFRGDLEGSEQVLKQLLHHCMEANKEAEAAETLSLVLKICAAQGKNSIGADGVEAFLAYFPVIVSNAFARPMLSGILHFPADLPLMEQGVVAYLRRSLQLSTANEANFVFIFALQLQKAIGRLDLAASLLVEAFQCPSIVSSPTVADLLVTFPQGFEVIEAVLKEAINTQCRQQKTPYAQVNLLWRVYEARTNSQLQVDLKLQSYISQFMQPFLPGQSVLSGLQAAAERAFFHYFMQNEDLAKTFLSFIQLSPEFVLQVVSVSISTDVSNTKCLFAVCEKIAERANGLALLSEVFRGAMDAYLQRDEKQAAATALSVLLQVNMQNRHKSVADFASQITRILRISHKFDFIQAVFYEVIYCLLYMEDYSVGFEHVLKLATASRLLPRFSAKLRDMAATFCAGVPNLPQITERNVMRVAHILTNGDDLAMCWRLRACSELAQVNKSRAMKRVQRFRLFAAVWIALKATRPRLPNGLLAEIARLVWE